MWMKMLMKQLTWTLTIDNYCDKCWWDADISSVLSGDESVDISADITVDTEFSDITF